MIPWCVVMHCVHGLSSFFCRIFPSLPCVSKPGSDVAAAGPAPRFHLKRGRGLTELDKGEKNKEKLTSRQVGEWVHLPRLFSGDEEKKSLPSWWVSQHGHGGPWFSTWGYGAVEDLWLLWVWQLGENRLRRIWTSIQSPARTVENMAGYQVPSLPSYGWKVSHKWVICEPVYTKNVIK